MSASLLTPNYNLPYYKEGDTLNFTDYNNSMLKIDTGMAENRNKTDTQSGQIEELTTNVENLTTNQTQNNETLADHTKHLLDLQTQQNNIEHHVEDLETEVTGNQEAIEALQNASTSQNEEIVNIKTDVTKNTTSIASNTSQISSLTSRLNETETVVGSQGTDISTMQNDVNNLKNTTQELNTEYLTLSGEVASNKADIDDINNNKLTTVDSKLQIANTRINDVQENTDNIKQKLVNGLNIYWYRNPLSIPYTLSLKKTQNQKSFYELKTDNIFTGNLGLYVLDTVFTVNENNIGLVGYMEIPTQKSGLTTFTALPLIQTNSVYAYPEGIALLNSTQTINIVTEPGLTLVTGPITIDYHELLTQYIQ